MRVSRWGNSLAIRLPASVVEVLDLKEGDEVEVHVAGARAFDIARTEAASRRWSASAAFARSFHRTGSSIAMRRMRGESRRRRVHGHQRPGLRLHGSCLLDVVDGEQTDRPTAPGPDRERTKTALGVGIPAC